MLVLDSHLQDFVRMTSLARHSVPYLTNVVWSAFDMTLYGLHRENADANLC